MTGDDPRPKAPLRRVVPNGIPFLGHGLTVAWLLGAPFWIGVVGLLCDAADGATARRLGVTSASRALHDATVDVTVCALVLERIDALPLLLVAVPMQVSAHLSGRHVAGRAFASFVLVVLTLLGAVSREQGGAPACVFSARHHGCSGAPSRRRSARSNGARASRGGGPTR
jgi:phosphatidylglycerophosphate synthase